MQTRRYPRTIQEAFGPHSDRSTLYPMGHKEARYKWPDRVMYGLAGCVVILFLIGVL